MAKNVNVQKGKKGFQKTSPKAVSPSSSNVSSGFFSGLFNKNKGPVSTQHLDALNAKYEKVREGLGDNVKCRYCGKKKLYKLMKEPDGQIICQGCSSGGEGDNFIKSGEWLTPSPGEIRNAKKKDKEASNGSDSSTALETNNAQSEQLQRYARMHEAAPRPPFTDTP